MTYEDQIRSGRLRKEDDTVIQFLILLLLFVEFVIL